MLTSETETDIKNWYANTIHENLSMKNNITAEYNRMYPHSEISGYSWVVCIFNKATHLRW